jgi:hypothetical protein
MMDSVYDWCLNCKYLLSAEKIVKSEPLEIPTLLLCEF